MKRILLTLVAVLVLNSAYGQVKATSAELNAGIDDAKFATALALQGSKYLDQSGAKLYAVTAAGGNTYMAAITPAITAYSAGQVFFIKITTANTGASTLNLNGLGAKSLVKDVATALAGGDLLANRIYAVAYDGANFQVVNVADALKANLVSPAFTGVPTAPTAAAGTNTTQLATTAFVNSAAGADQTLSLGINAGEISISGTSGNTVGLLNLGRHTIAYQDANTIPVSGGFFPFSNIVTSALNYPLPSAGGGFKYYRTTGSATGSFELWKESSNADALYFRTGSGTTSFNAWDIVAGRAWVSTQIPAAQTLSLNGNAGGVTLSGGGGTLSIPSVANTGSVDASTTRPAGLYGYTNTSGSVNYPSSGGGGIDFYRSSSTAVGNFSFWKSSGSTDNLYFRTGATASTWNEWDIVVGKAWLAGNYYNQTQSNTNFFGNGSANGSLIVAETVDVNALPAKTFATYANTTSTNLPENTGTYGGMLLHSSQSAGVNYFQQYMGRQGNDAFYYRNFAPSTAASPTWNRVASREWASKSFIGNGQNTGSLISTVSGADANAQTLTNYIWANSISTNLPITAVAGGTLGTFSQDVGSFTVQTYFHAGVEDSNWYRRRTSAGIWGNWYQTASRQWVNTQLQSISSLETNKLLGRYAAGIGAAQDVTLGAGLSLSSTGVLHAAYETGADGTTDKFVNVKNPIGGQLKLASTATGAIRIQLPSNTSIMYAIKGTLRAYEGTSTKNTSTTFVITCHSSSMGSGYSATFSGNNAPNYTVRWYNNGANPAVYIGDLTSTWSWTSISLDEIQASHTGTTADLVSEGWIVSLETAFTGTLAATQTNTLPFSNLNQPLAGFTAGADNVLSQSDSQIDAFGKIQGQLNAIKTVTGIAAGANLVYVGPLTGTANPTFRKLQRSDIAEAFGSARTSGILDWDDITNTQPGSGPTLLLGTATNGFGSSRYFHPFTFEYSTKNGTGNLTQMAYPYNPGATDGIQYRTRSSGTFSPWRKVWDSSNFTNINQLTTRNFGDLQGKPTTLTGYGITDGATSASVTAVQASVTALDGNAVHKAGIETITGTKFFNGGMGIGLAVATVPSAYKLAVGGGIIAESVKVKPQGEWPDYVFEKRYPMLSLGDLEKYILKNKHLPDVPAAAEVKKEGLDLGEMNTKLLQKIEELTLYLIEKDKEIKKLAETVGKLNEDIKTIKK